MAYGHEEAHPTVGVALADVRITIPQAFAVFTKGKKIYDAYKASDKSTAAALAAAGDMLKMLTDEGVTLADLSAILTIVGPFLGAIKK
jgi:hypothetical protein